MDRKILTVSIMTILVLFGAFWVIGASINEGVLSSYTWTNLTSHNISGVGGIGLAGVSNWSKGGGAESNLTFRITLNHTREGDGVDRDAGNVQSLITNITIRPVGSTSAVSGTTLDIGNMTMTAVNTSILNLSGGHIWEGNETIFNCRVQGGGMTIFCKNGSDYAVSNLSGNWTYIVWTNLTTNSTNYIEEQYDWYIEVADNNSNTSSLTIDYWGVDGAAPRLVDFSIADDFNEWNFSEGELDGSTAHTISNDTNVVIRFRINETNRINGTVALFWNVSNATGINLTADNGKGIAAYGGYPAIDAAGGYTADAANGTWLFANSSWNSATGTTVANVTCSGSGIWGSSRVADRYCNYMLTLSVGNFTNAGEDDIISFVLFTNDTFNQSSYYGHFNITIDRYEPIAGISVSKGATTYTKEGVTVTCSVVDQNETSDVRVSNIYLTKPDGSTVTIADQTSYTFMNDDTGLAGEYSTYCRVADVVNREGVSEVATFDIYYRTGSSSSSGGSGISSVADVDVSTSTPGEASGNQGESQTFTLDGTTTHRLTFLEVGGTTATILIESDPVEITLSVGESKEVTIDNSKVKITLDSIVNGKASVTIINVAAEKQEAESTGGETVGETVAGEGGIGTWLIVLIVVVVIVVIFFVLKGRKGKKGEMSFSRKDLK